MGDHAANALWPKRGWNGGKGSSKGLALSPGWPSLAFIPLPFWRNRLVLKSSITGIDNSNQAQGSAAASEGQSANQLQAFRAPCVLNKNSASIPGGNRSGLCGGTKLPWTFFRTYPAGPSPRLRGEVFEGIDVAPVISVVGCVLFCLSTPGHSSFAPCVSLT